MTGGEPEYYGLRGLSKLNTVAARAMLAEAAEGPADLYARWNRDVHWADNDPQEAARSRREAFARWRASAVHALARMGDRSYVPLLERLAGDDSAEVRQEAISNLGLLGGEAELPRLATLARSGIGGDSQGAILAMGDTGSLTAVPMLIDLFNLPDANEPMSSDLPLMTLTHHLVQSDEQRTAAGYQATWRQWWEQNGSHARAYGPFECAPDRSAR